MLKQKKQSEQLYYKAVRTARKAEVKRQAEKREVQRHYTALRHGDLDFL